MIPSNQRKDAHLLGPAPKLARIKVVTIASFFMTLALLPNSFHAADNSPSRFRLGPTLDEKEEKPTTPSGSLDSLKHFDQDEWNKMRRSIEGGYEETVTVSSPTAVSTMTATPPKPPPGLLNVDLPYESSLSITGRKVIKLDISNTHITPERAKELGTKQDTQSFNMEQELQARIQGTVARKTTINVNFDDTKENVKDFSVVYKGDPDEVVQEAAFGDIVLSLPSTEFVNYNKQLFGIRAALKYKRAGFMAIGSRTKGTTETKRFTGATTRIQKFKNDTEYVRRKFYDLSFATNTAAGSIFDLLSLHPAIPINGTQPEVVYVEDLSLNPQATFYIIASATAPTTTALSIKMKQLSSGVDYSIDRLRGIISFTNPRSEDERIAIDFTLNDGTRLSSLTGKDAILIKDKPPITPGVDQEIKRFYSLGDKNIARDNGLGNFVLKVLDKNRETEIGNTLSPIQKYPDTIDMKFETGIFELKQPLPFEDIYVSNVNSASALHVAFSLEYQSIIRTFTLRPNIVLQSEKIEVNGRKVSRDLDYFIDYDIGIVTFFNDDLIRESTVIEITYEFAPFGGVLGETLVGARGTFDILENINSDFASVEKWSTGSTVLYNFAAKPTGPPDVRSTPSSLVVTEGDTQLKGLKFGRIPVKTNFFIEAARSDDNPNLFGKAIIDSMEGIKQEDASSLLDEAWQPASNPVSGDANLVSDFRGREEPTSHLRWDDVDVLTSDPADGSAVTQKSLLITYDLNETDTVDPEQVSLINVISFGGRDFSKKNTLEVEIEGAAGASAGAGVELEISYGSFNEDADGDNTFDTEDQIPFDGNLNLGEDIGFVFNGPVGSPRVGVGNTRVDSEDLNSDRVLSTQDLSATDQPLFLLSTLNSEDGTASLPANPTLIPTTDINFSERRLFRIPLNYSSRSAEEQARLTSVKQVRVTLRNSDPTVHKVGQLKIIRLAVVGNSYEPGSVQPPSIISTITVRAVNNKDDSSYVSLAAAGNGAYNELYKDAVPAADAKEQALALDYELLAGSSGTTKNVYSVPRDFSKHDEFLFFVRTRNSCAANCGQFFLQVGSETEYQQATIDLVNISNTSWKLVQIQQRDLNTDGTPDTWVSDDPTVVIGRVGNVPNLTQISQLKFGVFNNNPLPASSTNTIANEVWINELHLSNPHSRTGHAKKYAFDSAWAGWMDFGGMYRDVDRNWQTPTTAVTNQDSTQSNMYVNFNRISFMPMTFKTTRDRNVTPSAFRSNQNALVSFFEEGRVERISNASTAKLIIPYLPAFDVSYLNDKTENTITLRREFNDVVNVGASYSPRINFDLLPTKLLTFRPLPSSLTLLHTRRTTKLRFPGLARLQEFNISTAPFSSTNLTQFSDENEARMAFKPWDGFSFNPTYRLKVDKERRDFRDDEKSSLPSTIGIDQVETPRSISQTIAASGNLKLLKWLDPRYNYSIAGTETNGLPTQSNTTAYAFKTISRNSQGEVSGAIQMNQVLPKVSLINSMNLNGSYKVENGDTYNDMPQGFKWRSQLWAGTPLAINTSTGVTNVARRVDATDRRTIRTNLAWQPLSAYKISNRRVKPFNTLSLTSNYLKSKEDTETTGTTKHVESLTWPDLILTINDTEDIFNIKKVIDNSRLVYKTNTRVTETRSVSRSKSNTWGTDYQFQFWKKLDVSTSYNKTTSRDDNLVTNTLNSKSDTVNYSIQTRIPWRVWAFTPRYEHNQNDTRDSIHATNDLVNDIFTLQIYGDISKPLGIRFGRKEIGLANRMILNSSIKWDKKRSAINPGTGYLDIYTATLSGDYTISQNFRLAVGGNYSQEVHHPDFKKLDTSNYGINSTLTIQF